MVLQSFFRSALNCSCRNRSGSDTSAEENRQAIAAIAVLMRKMDVQRKV